MSTEEPPPESPSEATSQPRRRGFRTGRLEAFSDGVFAIAITLLVLDIGVSATAGQDLGARSAACGPPTWPMWPASPPSARRGWGTTRSPSTSTAPTPRSSG